MKAIFNSQYRRSNIQVKLFGNSVLGIRCWILTFLFFPSSFCYSQNKKSSGEHGRTIDSLKKILLTAKEDTNKVNALNSLSWQLRNTKLDTAVTLSAYAFSL